MDIVEHTEPAGATNSRCETLAELEEKSNQFPLLAGWTKLRTDEPLKGQVGYVVFRRLRNGAPVTDGAPFAKGDTEEVHSFYWEPFGPQETVLNEVPRGAPYEQVRDLLKGLAAKPRLYKADDPMRLLIGFVYYEVGKANVTRIRLSDLKLLARDQDFMTWRNNVPYLSTTIFE
jgi:hypothetical protein